MQTHISASPARLPRKRAIKNRLRAGTRQAVFEKFYESAFYNGGATGRIAEGLSFKLPGILAECIFIVGRSRLPPEAVPLGYCFLNDFAEDVREGNVLTFRKPLNGELEFKRQSTAYYAGLGAP